MMSKEAPACLEDATQFLAGYRWAAQNTSHSRSTFETLLGDAMARGEQVYDEFGLEEERKRPRGVEDESKDLTC